jgi:hypothetical protein
MEAGQTPPPGPGGPGDAPQTEEELRARLEEEMRRVRVQDLLLQSVASLVNLTARRIAKEDERDLEQARVGIEAVRALVDLLEPEPAQQVKAALSELQMLYAQASGGGGGPAGDGESEEPKPQPEAPPSQERPAPQQAPPAGGRQAPPRLWTPHQRD